MAFMSMGFAGMNEESSSEEQYEVTEDVDTDSLAVDTAMVWEEPSH
jgi:hypothetical protein